MDDDTAPPALDRTIGLRLGSIRNARRKSQRVIAELAGISASHLSRLESGERSVDRLSLIVALANALEIAPSELTRLPLPAPANGHTDSSIEAVRRALRAASRSRPGGLVLPVDVLRSRVAQVQQRRRDCEFAEVGTALPGLIADLHTSITTGRDGAELLPLAVLLHVQVVNMWLKDVAAPVDLLGQVADLALDVAHEHGDLTTLGLAAFGSVYGLLAAGLFDLAQAELDSITLPATTPETAGLVCVLTMTHSVVAALDKRPGDMAAPMEAAAELAERLGEDDPLGFGFGPTSLRTRRMSVALEEGEPERAVIIAEGVRPERLPFATRRAGYWVDYGRALARLRGRHGDAVKALRRAEMIHPHRVHRDPLAREVLAELVTRSKQDAVGREVRGMAYRAGLLV